MPAFRAATAVSRGSSSYLDDACSCRRAYGDALTLAFPPLGSLSAFQRGVFSGPAEACNALPAAHAQAVSSRSPLGASALSLRFSVVHMLRSITKNQLEWFLC